MKEHFISGAYEGIRFDSWCKKELGIPHGLAQKLVRKKEVKINGTRPTLKQTLHTGDSVVIYASLEARVTKPVQRPLSAKEIDVTRGWVIRDDEHSIILNKPSGMAVQGGSRISDSVDRRLDALADADTGERPKLVHRLDKDTSGILLLAKGREKAAAMTEAFRHRNTQKIYWALVAGVPDDPIGTIDTSLGKVVHQRGEKMSVVIDDSGQSALTHYRVVRSNHRGTMSWLELRPITGRTHQLRVHCQSIGHPIIGDGKYGGRDAYVDKKLAAQLHLHARYLSCSTEYGRVWAYAAMPEHMEDSWHHLEFPMDDDGVSLLEMKL